MNSRRAVVVDAGVPGRLAIREIEQPRPAPSEALVRVETISLNQGEVRRAMAAPDGSLIGWDLAGTVERAAADGSGPPLGARVVGFVANGSWADLVAVPTNALAELPPNVTFAQAATLPVAGLTALHILERGTGLLARRILITGASGGVGLFMCQLAQMMGAHVVGLIRQEAHAEMVRAAGARDVLLSPDGLAAREHGPYRLIADAIGGRMFANVLGMLGPDGVCVSYGTLTGEELALPARPFAGAARASLYNFILFNDLAREPGAVGLERLARLVGEGRLRPHIDVEAAWDQIGDVVQRLLSRQLVGKAVLHIPR